MFDSEDGGFDMMECVNMEVHASADLTDVCDGKLLDFSPDCGLRFPQSNLIIE